jgi:DNA polymerase elongation subunit (family B)
MTTAVIDIEVYRDFFMVAALDIDTGRTVVHPMHDASPLDIPRVRRLLTRNTLVTFNGTSFDLPILAYALAGASCAQLKAAADAIIERNLRGWQFAQAFNVELLEGLDHIDLIEVAPAKASLKLYGGRLHTPKLQDLPIEPHESIPEDRRQDIIDYCLNDLRLTAELYRSLLPQIELRARMGEQYGMDLRSKSDAQIAEAVIVSEVERARGKPVERPTIKDGTVYRYAPPAWLTFTSEPLRALLEDIRRAEFIVQANGAVREPDELLGRTVTIGAGVYRLGIGGLHSSETCQAVEVDEDYVLLDRDVASYYPSIILRLGLAPEQMGQAFLRVYQSIVDRRLAAKAAGDKVTADTLKICVNGSFGKLGSKYSKLYSPDLLVQVTLTGQLALLMLIEALESVGIAVVSANTDGIVIRAHKLDVAAMRTRVEAWESRTGFVTEETAYAGLYSRDVNNYIAIKPDGGAKLKGTYAQGGLSKNPVAGIAVDAALRWLRDRSDIGQTIRACTDVRKFLVLRTVKGGAIDQRGEYLGKAIRWYYARGVDGALRYRLNGYTVPRSDGAQPLMDLPEQLPGDIDYDWYEREALSILNDCGALGGLA